MVVQQLTTSQITALTLRFLRGYYQNYERAGNLEINTNLRGEGGIVADGYLAFRQPEERYFTVTFEATDYMAREELRFSILYALLRADALATALACTATGLAIAQGLGALWFIRDFYWLGLVLLLGTVLLFFVLFYRLLRPLPRYRYIYAIQQFRQYYADDQWVAFAHDVFAGYEDPYFRELHDQCVRNGFGLVEVAADQRVKLHVAPAVIDPEFLLLRKIVPLFTQNNFARLVGQQVQRFDFWSVLLRRWRPLQADIADLRRFQRPIYHQIIIGLLAILLMAGIWITERPQPSMIVLKEEAHEQEMTELMEQLRVEPEPSAANPPELTDSSAVVPFAPAGRARSAPSIPASTTAEVLVYLGPEWVSYPCSRLQTPNRSLYLVHWGRYADEEQLTAAAQRYRRFGLAVNGLRAACFQGKGAYYVLFLENLYPDAVQARQAAAQVSQFFRQNNLTETISINKL